MPRFFVHLSDLDGETVTLRGDNALHIAYALRMAAGEHVAVSCEDMVYDCVLEAFSPDKAEPWVTARIVKAAKADTEPPYRAVLYQALPKGDKLDTIIQKAVECGVTRIVPFESSRCIARVKPEAETRKTERRQKIAEEAAKQCRRGIIPEVTPTVRYDDVLSEARTADLVLFCYEAEGTLPLGGILSRKMPLIPNGEKPTVAVIVGAEGGFSPEEAEAAREAGFSMTGLGKRILRCETAPTFVLSCLAYQYELT
ncbi:MAG: 16S rRNA (uracil(1498)-N(3))-methyltransferase [Ruminococcaceae bacterium]|nr:16S rRNA (uracil(1498)-N(3))-methyltransferase [Oscillospiraceae bacterium]